MTILLSILPRFWSLVQLAFVLMSWFAVLGMQLFGGGWDGLDEPPKGSFQTLTGSYLLLFELLVGNDWNSIMEQAATKYGSNSVLYFFFYIIIVTIFFTNLFIGVLLDSFTMFLSAEKTETSRVKQAILEGMHPQQGQDELTMGRERIFRTLHA